MQSGTTPAPRKRRPIILTPRILSAFPTITDVTGQELHIDSHGVIHPRRRCLVDPPSEDETALAFALLLLGVRVKSPTWVSYALKGRFEVLGAGRIGNGSLIIAAHQLGYPVAWVVDSLNCRIGVSRRWVRSLESSREG